MKSLIQKLQGKKLDIEIENAHKEALQIEDKLKYFFGANSETRHRIFSEIENDSIKNGETILVTYWDGKPVFGKKMQARGKIKDVQYDLNPAQDKVDGYFVLNTGIFRSKKIPFDSIESAEYKPEIREKKEREELKRQKKENREYQLECRRREAHNAKVLNYAFRDNISLALPQDISTRDYLDLLEDIRSVGGGFNYNISSANCRGPRTGLGYGNFEAIAVENGSKVIFAVGLHEGDYFVRNPGVRAYVPTARFQERICNPSFPWAGISRLEDKDARIFLSNLYGVWNGGR